MRFDVITLFPEVIEKTASMGVVGRAISSDKIQLKTWNPRDFTEDVHRRVDDRPFGGGPGMVMKIEPLRKTIQSAVEFVKESTKVIYLSPQGRRLDQQGVNYLSQFSRLVLLAGRYEGIDERLLDDYIDEEWSIGDFVLSGGELPALVLMDAVARTLPGVLGHECSANEDSFIAGLLDHPHYTRPDVFDGVAVPDVLLTGDHKKIATWREKQALGKTWQKRPDLLEKIELSKHQQSLLDEYIQEQNNLKS
ncbi:MAG: tRNA (guanosine(37)-N1)-methyltransferase TrmD [Cycloclasticus sp.]|jgi:tRNA (guanine37-N1)-methyltransferase|nr:MAG: tRNA (guanine-N1)-methyltransferase [Cycloclasticus sp. Phe_18]MBV1912724.1 tRNA (guanosine(37)-N1)-methyltransferase TrmD [Cycloclasticus sp.]MDF1688602.1 tRNA (guanosine(37)-N1)-methyltransferase TrmD [Cycloclasticus sp.]MEE4291531.1 tRNA (guanosine(37)-N1)-methyltransferase TrmD [Cycloclasticus sp.]